VAQIFDNNHVKTSEAVREALFEGRTAVYYDHKLIGLEKYLMALFGQSLSAESVIRITGGFSITLKNHTDIPIELSKTVGNDPEMEFFSEITIPAGATRNIAVHLDDAEKRDFIELKLMVDNFLIGPGKGMPVSMIFQPD